MTTEAIDLDELHALADPAALRHARAADRLEHLTAKLARARTVQDAVDVRLELQGGLDQGLYPGDLADAARRLIAESLRTASDYFGLDIAQHVRASAARRTGGRGDVRVRLADLRDDLAERCPRVGRAAIDRALLAAQRRGALVLLTADDPREITARDQAAALEIHGEPHYFLYSVR